MSAERLDSVASTLANNASFTEQVSSEQQRIADEGAAAEEATLLAGMVEAAYLIAMADGEMTQEEADAMSEGLYKLSNITTETLTTLFGVAAARHENEGQAARIAALGTDIPDADHRQARSWSRRPSRGKAAASASSRASRSRRWRARSRSPRTRCRFSSAKRTADVGFLLHSPG